MYLILLYIISNWAGTVANFMRDFYVGAAATATGSSIADAQNAVAGCGAAVTVLFLLSAIGTLL